jgi:hypothetical protein
MPSEPTREELLAQVAALQLELAQRWPEPPPAAIPTSPQPSDKPPVKTTQLDERRVVVPRDLLEPRRRNSKATPEEILAQITGLKSVIISGVNSAGYGDKRTEFRSLTELRQILNDLEDELAEASGQRGPSRQVRMVTNADKGL